MVVFGGGDCTLAAESLADTGALVLCSKGLGFTNGGDSVTLRDENGELADTVTYGGEGGKDKSLNRTTDGDPEALLDLHQGDLPFSPGTKMDGSLF